MSLIHDPALNQLRHSLRGHVYDPGEPDYEEACTLFNSMVERRPRYVARCSHPHQVAAALAYARDRGLCVAVRAGGHSVAGLSLVDDGLVIDVRGLRDLIIDPVRRIARVGAGLTWGEVDAATQEHGLATVGGRVSTTGVAGLTLGGGSGWLERTHGLTVDNVLAMELVTAAGNHVRASADEHPDLFWALRGGGGNFGVVTSLDYRLHPVGPLVFAGPVFYAAADAAQVLRGWRDLTATMPDELTTLANILVAPPVPFLPEAVHGQMVIGIIGVYAGSVEDGTRAAQPLRTLAEPIADLMGPMPYTTMQSLLDPLWPAGAQNYFTGTMLRELTDDAIETLLARHAVGRAPVHELHLHHGGGAMANAPAGGTAFAHRDATYILNIIARSADREGFETHAGWARATHQAMDPWSTGGGYVNFTSEPGQDKVQASYPPTTYARLVAAKDRYDPTNLFQLNQNIRPSGGR